DGQAGAAEDRGQGQAVLVRDLPQAQPAAGHHPRAVVLPEVPGGRRAALTPRRRQPHAPAAAAHTSRTWPGSGTGETVKVSTPPLTDADQTPGPLNANRGVTSPGLLNPAGRLIEVNVPAVYGVVTAGTVGLQTGVRATMNLLPGSRFARLSVPAGAADGLTVSLSVPATGDATAALYLNWYVPCGKKVIAPPDERVPIVVPTPGASLPPWLAVVRLLMVIPPLTAPVPPTVPPPGIVPFPVAVTSPVPVADPLVLVTSSVPPVTEVPP